MSIFSRLLNRVGSQTDRDFAWAKKALPEVTSAGADLGDLDDAALRERALAAFADYSGDAGAGRSSATLARDPKLHAAAATYAAIAREAAERTVGERPFDAQILGMFGLLTGHVVEMGTGEGKTLVGALAAGGFALQGRAVQVLTVNDYLAERDEAWMRPFFDLIGVSSAAIGQDSTLAERQAAYASDICYAAVSEAGFDALRDRFIEDDAELRIPRRDVLIVDEADSILIDEARVPLVLAGSTEVDAADADITAIVAGLDPDNHYEVSPDRRSVSLTDAGIDAVEQQLDGADLYGDDADALAAVNLALYARALVTRDVDYLVTDGRVRLISSSRGRVAELQRWPDGLQAAIEAKEQLETSSSGEILDSMTVEELITSYPLIAGMTGTALAVGDDLREFYELEVVVIEPNIPVQRVDEEDRLFALNASKEKAMIAEIVEQHATGRPILIGTQSVADSERLAAKLVERGIRPQVLNAKDIRSEADIIGRAGQRGAVTVSTQMAGRGTDIRLGDDEVIELGGLLVIGSGRYPSSRLDGQLRGRAGRQGDPGRSIFFTSLDDPIVQRAEEASRFTSAADANGRIESRRAHQTVDHAQRIVEGENTAIHRDTVKFNELVQKQRELVLRLRAEARAGDDVIDRVIAASDKADAELDGAAREIVRAVTLFHLDERWVAHLALLTDLREGIHLRTLARERPYEAFNTESIQAFDPFEDDVVAAAAATVDEIDFAADEIDLPAYGIKRPTSTWTYLTTESTFSSDIEAFVKRAQRRR